MQNKRVLVVYEQRHDMIDTCKNKRPRMNVGTNLLYLILFIGTCYVKFCVGMAIWLIVDPFSIMTRALKMHFFTFFSIFRKIFV